MVEIVTEVVEEKMPESPWHNKWVESLKEPLEEHLRRQPEAVVFRDLFFEHGGKRYAPDLAVVFKGAPPLETIGLVYRVPEDGPSPDAIIEVAVSPKALGEALGVKVDFYERMKVKDYLVVGVLVGMDVRLWLGKPAMGEWPTPVREAFLESLGVSVKAEGEKVRVYNKEGKEILPAREIVRSLQEALEQERAKREEIARSLQEALEQERAKWKEIVPSLQEALERERAEREEIVRSLQEALEQERAKREGLERKVAELERLLREQSEC